MTVIYGHQQYIEYYNKKYVDRIILYSDQWWGKKDNRIQYDWDGIGCYFRDTIFWREVIFELRLEKWGDSSEMGDIFSSRGKSGAKPPRQKQAWCIPARKDEYN